MFNKILIANRGEIACRVIRSAKKMGIATVAVYSHADANAQHVKLADEAICIGPAPARESYLLIDKIIAAAKQTGAQAIHPGYGFLSENEAFAEACRVNDVVFIGPPVAAINAMGLKATAKALMEKAGVPLTPGYHGDNQDPQFLHQEADRIGYPLLIKASAGGGGKGMSLVEASDQFLNALASCQREATASFGNADVLLEKYITRPRHIEVQVFGDSHGNYVHFFERDCSVQRRHQKVLEEAPAPNVSDAHLAAMREAAINAARAVGYVGAGTVEFIAHQSGEFYFMEMNTRLQVEHPVSEMITGEDLVEWQLRVAFGEPLPKTQDQLSIRGHALEARIYAEDPDKGFLPSTGQIVYMHRPETNDFVRIDSGVEAGDVISAYYDPMIAKLIVWGEDRAEALNRMHRALGEFNVLGLSNNIAFLRRLVGCASFTQADLDTGLIEREQQALLPSSDPVPESVLGLASLGLLLQQQQGWQQRAQASADAQSPWHQADGWRLNGYVRRKLNLLHQGEPVQVVAHYQGQGQFDLLLNGQTVVASGALDAAGALTAVIAGQQKKARVIRLGNVLSVFVDGDAYTFTYVDPYSAVAEEAAGSNHLAAPMPGQVVKVWVNAGDAVKKGDALMVLEAMKMEHTITAPADGIIESVLFGVTDQVADGDELLVFAEGEKETSDVPA
ncbi:MAG: acetyl/propionyl/methylcrotonyl-CoA carboxylase subunit alpha [Neisseriaceae bacterium]|nr:acetyl/propionyl/methylcrotonyl-CoA carboxylase subunit alpha [Neisseriaceae bacterium]MBP6861437.1 acetyl/propionyl/methylcrotonyl-CoA carboxylase subunit alpha [Neisseriaceae bacterium]